MDGRILYPAWDGSVPPPGSTFFLTTPTTYDGNWSFFFDMPAPQSTISLWDGGLDFGTLERVGSPSGVPLEDTKDTDDPDTPNEVPDFAIPSPIPPGPIALGVTPVSTVVPEGAQGSGRPPDDNRFDFFRRGTSVTYVLVAPDGRSFENANPSGNNEFERFTVTSSPTLAADHRISGPPPAGRYEVRLRGLDLANQAYFRFPFEVLGVGPGGQPPAGVPVSGPGRAFGSAIVDASALGGNARALVHLDVWGRNVGRPRGKINGTIVGADRRPIRFRTIRIDTFAVTDVPGGRQATITGAVRIDRIGVVAFTAVARDGGTPGVPVDAFTMTFNGTTIGGQLLPAGENFRSRNEIQVRPGSIP